MELRGFKKGRGTAGTRKGGRAASNGGLPAPDIGPVRSVTELAGLTLDGGEPGELAWCGPKFCTNYNLLVELF